MTKSEVRMTRDSGEEIIEIGDEPGRFRTLAPDRTDRAQTDAPGIYYYILYSSWNL